MSPQTADPILESLATALHQQGWYASTELVPLSLCDALYSDLKSLYETQALHKAQIGGGGERQTNASVRGDYIRWMEGDRPAEALFFGWIQQLMETLNRRLFLGMQSHEFHYACYPPSAGYDRHIDTFRGSDDRVLSFVLYLNPSWTPADGGQLSLFLPSEAAEKRVEIVPIFSQCAVFLSNQIPHQVNLTNSVRFSVTGWLKKSPLARF